MAITSEEYLGEYTTAYEQVVGQSMEFLTEGKHTHLEKLFKIIDDQSSDTTLTERLSMKKNAYLALMDKVTVASQRTAMELVDRKYKLEHEIVGMVADADVKVAKMVNEKIIAGYVLELDGVTWTAPTHELTSGFHQLEKMITQQSILEDQAAMTNIDLVNKPANVAADLANKDATLASMEADTAFSISKETVMVDTRSDNIRIKASESFAEFMKYMSAADIIPATEDFSNLRSLVDAIGLGLATPTVIADIEHTVTTDFQTK